MTLRVKVNEKEYEAKRMALAVPDPWSDPFSNKIKLTHMYIESTLTELLKLRAEQDPGVKLNCPNPVYEQFHKLFTTCLKTKNKSKSIESIESIESNEPYKHLKQYIEDTILCRSLKIIIWDGYVPDIRLLDTIDEAMSWLHNYLI